MEIEELRRQLASTEPTPAGQDEALRFVTGPEASKDLIEAVAPELFEWVMGSNYRCERARVALLRLDSETFRRVIVPQVDRFVADDQHDGWDFEGVLSLLTRTQETDLVELVIDAGRRSSDEEIQEAVSSYRERGSQL